MNNPGPSVRRVSIEKFSKCALALAVASTLASWAHAAEEAVKTLPTVKVESEAEDAYKVERSNSIKQSQPLIDTPKTITVIPKAVMQDRGVENLRDALRSVPGISLAAGEGGQPTGDSMSIRGFSARTDILIDGIRDIAGYTRDVYNLESVEVSKGPGSAVSGRGATGGSINLQSKSAKLDDISELGLAVGTANDYRATLDTNKSLGDTTALRVNLLSDDGEVAGRDEVSDSKYALALSVATGLETATRFSLNAEYQQQDNLPDYGLPWVSAGAAAYTPALENYAGGAPNADFSNFYGNVYRDFEDITAQSLTAKFERDLGSSTMLRVQARVGSVARESIVTAPRFIDLATSTDVRQSDEKTRDTNNGLRVIQLDLIGHYNSGSISHDVVTGIEVAQETEKRWTFDDFGTDNLDTVPVLVDLYNPNSHLEYNGEYGRDGTSTKAVGDTAALYAFDTLTFNSQWELTLGARWESFKTEYQYDYVDPSLELNAKDTLFSWNAGLVYKPARNGTVYLGLGNSFNPSTEALTASTTGNAHELDPEESSSYELGTKWELFGDKLLFNAALFRTEKNRARTDDPFAENTNSETLNGEQRVDGLELSAVGQMTEQLSLTAAYTFQDSEVLKAEGADSGQEGNPLPRTPEHSASLWLSYAQGDKWIYGIGAQYLSERYNSSDILSREGADSFVTADLMLAFNVTEQLRIQFNGFNLADEKYVDQLGGGHFIPGEGRRFVLSGNYSF